MHEELLLQATQDERARDAAANALRFEARRAPPATTRPEFVTGHAAGAWCWLLDLLPARARRHAVA